MAIYQWTGANNSNASDANNWLVGGVVASVLPGASDTLEFTTSVAVVNQVCILDILNIGSIIHNHQEVFLLLGGAGTNHTISGTFVHNGAVGLSNQSVGEIEVKFNNSSSGTGDLIYTPQSASKWIDSTLDIYLAPILSAAARAATIPKLKFTFATNNPPCISHGIYTTVQLDNDVLPHYNANEADGITATEADFYHLITTNSGSFVVSNSGTFATDSIKEIDKTFRVRNFTMATKRKFEGGKGHWIFHAAGSNYTVELPLSGTGRQDVGSGVINQFENISVVQDEESGNFEAAIPPGNHYLKRLTVAEGVRLRARSFNVSELHIASRPNIRGSWQFFAIDDGIYRSKADSMIEPLDKGGTNTREYIDKKIPYVNATAPNAPFLDMKNGMLEYDSSSETLGVGAGGIQFNDGTTQTTAATGGGGGGGGVTVQDEGVALATVGTTLNFVDGQHPVQTVPTPQPFCVEATGSGAAKTITIDGSKIRCNATDPLPTYLDAKLLTGPNMSISLDTSAAASTGHGFLFNALNDKSKVSSADTTEGFLENKLVAGTGVTLTKLNAGGNEAIEITESGGGGSSGYPLFRHDQAPATNNFNPFRLLANGDTIELGCTSAGDGNKNVSVFTPANDGGSPATTVDIIAIESDATNTGREYMFFGQDERMGITEYQTFNSGTPNTAIPIYFVESMRDVALGMIGATKLRILPATRDTRLNNVRVMDAGNHTVTPDGESPITVRILLVVDYVQLRDRGRFLSNNYELTA